MKATVNNIKEKPTCYLHLAMISQPDVDWLTDISIKQLTCTMTVLTKHLLNTAYNSAAMKYTGR